MKLLVALCLFGAVALSSAVNCPSMVGYVADPDNSEKYFMCLFYKPIQRSCGSGNAFDVTTRNCLPVGVARQEFPLEPPTFTTMFPEEPPIFLTDSTTTEASDDTTLPNDRPTPSVVTTTTDRPTPPLILDSTTPLPTPPLITFTTDVPTITPPVFTTAFPGPPISTTAFPGPPISTTINPGPPVSTTFPSVPISTTDVNLPNVPVSTTFPSVPISTTFPSVPVSTTLRPGPNPQPEIVCPSTGIHRFVNEQFCNRFFLCVEGCFYEMNCQTGTVFDHIKMQCMENGRCHINGWMFE